MNVIFNFVISNFSLLIYSLMILYHFKPYIIMFIMNDKVGFLMASHLLYS